MSSTFLKRTWAEVNLDCLKDNIKIIKQHISQNTDIMAVVKADGYGHGDRYIARTLSDCGIGFFAVSNLNEALSLRNADTPGEILILGFTPVQCADVLIRNNITQTVFSLKYANELNAYCESIGCSVKVHIKLDTGMSRLGLIQSDCHDAADEIKNIVSLKSLDVCGIFSHFSSADTRDADSVSYTRLQIQRFDSLLAKLHAQGIEFPSVHMQNSAGIEFWPELNEYTHVRSGIVMYGAPPSNEPMPFEVYPVMSLKSVISMVKEVEKGTAISYGRQFTAPRSMKIATIPIGYADGYPRLLSNKGEMLVHGKRAPILGNICMDQLMLDVSGIDNVAEGDVVTVVGTDGTERITFWDLANEIGSIGYELMCLIGRRVPRVYIENVKTIAVVDYLAGALNME